MTSLIERTTGVTEPAQLASFAIARTGSITSNMVEELNLAETVREISSIFFYEAKLQELSESLELVLYSLVPATGNDRNLRQRILLMKRNIHNNRLWPEAAQDIALVTPFLIDPDQQQRLAEWFETATNYEKAKFEAEQLYQQETEQAGKHLAESLKNPVLQQGLALASPELLEELTRGEEIPTTAKWQPTSKLARSGLAYLTRAALKTSPLTTFTHLNLVNLEDNKRHSGPAFPAQTQPAQTKVHNSLSLVLALPAAWVKLIANDSQLAPALYFEPNQGMFRQANSEETIVLTGNYTLDNNFAWNDEKFSKVKLNPAQFPKLYQFLESDRGLSYSQLVELLNDCGLKTNYHKFIRQLMEKQLLRPVTPYSNYEANPVKALALALDRLENERAKALVARLFEIASLTQIAGGAGGKERLKILAQLRHAAYDVFEMLASPAPDWLKTSNLLYEDTSLEGLSVELNQFVKEDLKKVAALLRPGIIRNKLYSYLYQHFVEHYAANSEGVDVLRFIHEFISRSDFGELLMEAMTDNRMAVRERNSEQTSLASGVSAAPPAASVFYQIAASSKEALARGDYKLVVNQISVGSAGFMGRWHRLLDAEHGDLADRLNRWLCAIYPEARVLETSIVGDWNNLQRKQGLAKQSLAWPNELSGINPDSEANIVRLFDLKLKANLQNNTLYLVDRAGQAVAPVYTGVIPMHLAGQIPYLFLTLLNPWVQNYKVKQTLENSELVYNVPEEVEFNPRQEESRLVLSRACWRVPRSRLPIRDKAETPFAFFVRVQRWRQTYGLPEEVFVQTEHEDYVMDAKVRKPLWISFSSPYSLEMLRQLFTASEAQVFVLTEVLPSREQHWVKVGATGSGKEEGRASEFISLISWPSPVQDEKKVSRNFLVRPGTKDTYSDDPWLYFKIYPQKTDQLEAAIREIAGPAQSLIQGNRDYRRWFFIRYIDERGMHLRLRVQAPLEALEVLNNEIAGLIITKLPHLTSSLPKTGWYSQYTKKLPLPASQYQASGFVLDCYKPEYDRYGGEIGVKIAEEFFEISSNLTIGLLNLETQLDLDRTLAGLYLMRLLVAKAYKTTESYKQFLSDYLWYWSGQWKPGATGIRTNLMREAKANSRDLPAHLEQIEMTKVFQPLIQLYEQGLDNLEKGLLDHKELVQRSFQRMCFNYLHMTNNRLGILPSEESYMAALLNELVSI